VGEFEPLGPKALDSFDFSEWASIYTANVTAPTAMIFAFLALLKKGAATRPGQGATSSVINVGSTMAQIHLSMGGVVRFSLFFPSKSVYSRPVCSM